MKRIVLLAGAVLLLAPKAWAERPQPDGPSVSLFEPRSEEERAAAERLASELLSEGYAVEWLPGERSPCEAPGADHTHRTEHAWIRVTSTGEAFVCYRSPNGGFSSATAHAWHADSATLALSAVEALNGLRSNPVSAPSSRPPVAVPDSPPRPSARSSLSAGASFAFVPPEFPPLLGVRLELQSGLGEQLSLAYDGFVTVRSGELERTDRRIDLSVAWMRIGPRFSAPLSIASVDFSLMGGPALVWTEADVEPPLVASPDNTAAGVISLAVGLELPRRSAFFLRVAGQGSLLVPRVEVETGDGAVPAWTFVETSLGLGFRWPHAR